MNTSSTPMTAEQIDRLARKRAGAKAGWFMHAAIYVIVNLGLAGMALAGGRTWHVYPLLGWGLGLAIHGAAVWLAGPGATWRERLVAQERERIARGG
ncbi:2TM domain-containing protein [Ottowia sp. SB7-C50]|uniref:2TM domain-containing protein n=1 Tax=Ottowia sp. SB7-C50 TaxID=3081231 RepID=UPI00295357CA|nr:2TM domain-containing protein [Ottowia sp. SB7-C50]WOP14318.1 2TM domain-containing protein [Ottowia sp. SB7-C50]